MSIQVSCPSCKSDVFVDEALAGRDILCPSCKQRMTVPSIAAGRPDIKLSGSEIEESDAGQSGAGAGLPRWREGDDYDVPRRDSTRWNGTLTGLNLIFWSSLIMLIMVEIVQGMTLAMGNNPQMFGPNPQNPKAPPPPEAMAFGLGIMGVGCIMMVLFIIWFVGVCMCCTVPAESGAKGKAIGAVILVVLAIVGGIIGIVALIVYTVGQVQRIGAPPPPGQPVAAIIGFVIGISIFAAVFYVLWMVFTKSIAHYFGNERLARHCIWFLIFYFVTAAATWVLNVIANPMFHGGDMLAAQGPLMIISQIWAMALTLAVSGWYLWINRETKRTILEDQPAADADGPEEEHM